LPLSAGTKLGPYEIVAPAGLAGWAKCIAPSTRGSIARSPSRFFRASLEKPEARERFEREARSISQLSHANVCQLFDLGQQNGIHYIVMEFLEGETLASRLAKGRLPIDPAALKAHGGDTKAAVGTLVDSVVKTLFAHRDENRFLEVQLRSGRNAVLYRGDLISGAIIASIVERAKKWRSNAASISRKTKVSAKRICCARWNSNTPKTTSSRRPMSRKTG